MIWARRAGGGGARNVGIVADQMLAALHPDHAVRFHVEFVRFETQLQRPDGRVFSAHAVIHKADGPVISEPKTTGRVPRRPARGVREERNTAAQLPVLNKPLGAHVKTLQVTRRAEPDNPIEAENAGPTVAESVFFAED